MILVALREILVVAKTMQYNIIPNRVCSWHIECRVKCGTEWVISIWSVLSQLAQMSRELAINAHCVIGSIVWRTVLSFRRADFIIARLQRPIDPGWSAIEIGLALVLDRPFNGGHNFTLLVQGLDGNHWIAVTRYVALFDMVWVGRIGADIFANLKTNMFYSIF